MDSSGAVNENRSPKKSKNVYGDFNKMQGENAGYGKEEVDVWECHEDCPVKELDRQSGTRKSGSGNFKRSSAKGYQGNSYGAENRPEGTEMISYGDSGGASRFFKQFFYAPKASKSEKNKGLTDIINDHVCVKNLALCRYLVKLVTPPDGVVLDPFTGSGSIGVAALESGFNFIGIEMDAHYHEIATKRLQATQVSP